MSAYREPHPQGYDTGRQYQEASYTYTAPPYSSQSSLPPSTTVPNYQHANQIRNMDYASHQARPIYDDHSGPYLNVGSTPIPEVTSYSPSRGPGGIKIFVHITALYELMTTSLPSFYLVFGQRKCPATVTKMVNQQGAACQYTVTAEVPQFSLTGSSSSDLAVYMLLESGDGELMGRVDVGRFRYIDDGSLSGNNTPIDHSKKRKVSEPVDIARSPVKRVSSQNLRHKDEYNAYSYPSSDGASSYSPYMAPSTPYGGTIVPQYTRPAGIHAAQPRPRQLSYGYASSSASSLPTIKTETSTQQWDPSYTSFTSNVQQGSGIPSNAAVHRPALSGLPSAAAANPPLIRTTLQQTPSPAPTPHGGLGHQYNSYSPFLHKAKLDLKGELKSMRDNWSETEWENKRRIVQFKRSQSGSTITATFQSVPVDERPQNSICVSCIYWEERENYYITSVDVIYLLEQLVAGRFTVEEKNRIRRNLEGFKPITVSKGKPESEEYFKVIMGFGTPKPRNIEKDVKVFHWDDLSSALNKIIGKYSASPSSILPPVPPLLTPVSSISYTTENSSAGISYASDHHGTASPRSITGSIPSTAYNSNIPTRVLTPHDQNPIILQNGPPDLRMSLSQNPHESTSQWQGSQHHMPNPQVQYQQYGNQSARGSWDISSYLENSATTTVGTSSGPPQSLNYPTQNSRNASDPSGSANENRNMGSLSSRQQSHQTSRK